MSSPKSKLRLAGALAALASLALAVSCRGFFVNPVLTSIAISPSAPQVAVGTQLSPALLVFGTYDDGTRSQVRSGVSWTSSDISIVSIDNVSGVITGVSLGTATITASAQALSATATATTYLTNVTGIDVTPSSQTISAGSPTAVFDFVALPGSIPITQANGGTVTISPPTTDLSCIASNNDTVCTEDSTLTPGTYTITMTYQGSNASKSATINATQ